MLLHLLLLVDHGKEEEKEENVSFTVFSGVFFFFCFVSQRFIKTESVEPP